MAMRSPDSVKFNLEPRVLPRDEVLLEVAADASSDAAAVRHF